MNDLNGPLYILDKQSKQLTTYLDFNDPAGRPGLFQKLTFERNFATGLITFIFDPDYARNGVLRSTWRTRPRRRRRSRRPQRAGPRRVRLPDHAGERHADRAQARITREAVMIEWTDRNIANATFEGTARELLRMQLASPIHPLGEFTFNLAARPAT